MQWKYAYLKLLDHSSSLLNPAILRSAIALSSCSTTDASTPFSTATSQFLGWWSSVPFGAGSKFFFSSSLSHCCLFLYHASKTSMKYRYLFGSKSVELCEMEDWDVAITNTDISLFWPSSRNFSREIFEIWKSCAFDFKPLRALYVWSPWSSLIVLFIESISRLWSSNQDKPR